MTDTPAIGELTSVPIRDVWPNEAANLTPWLAENPNRPGLFGDALGMELELEGTEVAVGPFSADIVFRGRGALVVVENMMGSSDHDHLGKLMTYASGLEAAYASEGLEATYGVLLAEQIRPEHRTALQWMNTHTTDAAGFFGLELEAWRIGDSAPAPKLNVVVRPDGWARQVRSTQSTNDRQRLCPEFWAEFGPEFKATYPDWSLHHSSLALASRRTAWIAMDAQGNSVNEMHYSFDVTRKSGIGGTCVNFYPNYGDHEEAQRVYASLRAHQTDIEARFGPDLRWDDTSEGRTRCRVYAELPGPDFDIADRERWPEVREWAIERLGALRDAIEPYLDEL